MVWKADTEEHFRRVVTLICLKSTESVLLTTLISPNWKIPPGKGYLRMQCGFCHRDILPVYMMRRRGHSEKKLLLRSSRGELQERSPVQKLYTSMGMIRSLYIGSGLWKKIFTTIY